jgi:hypothetical protein
MTAIFEIMTDDNSQHITLSHCWAAAPMEAAIIGLGTKAVAWAVLGYAKRHNVSAAEVEYAVRPVPRQRS